MTVYQKVGGVWTAASRPYLKRNDVWTSVSAAYVKRSGVWVQAFEYDITPPNPPEISLELIENVTGTGFQTTLTRYIKVGVRLPGGANDPDARLARILTDYNGAPPTTQFGGTYTSAPDNNFPSEPWGEWRYNSFGTHSDTSVYHYKTWPRNATVGTLIKADTTYNFGGWSLDDAGNWSARNLASITVPKSGVVNPGTIVKEARFQPNSSGTWKPTTSGFVSGDLTQAKTPRSMGLWFYGNQITDSVGSQSSDITVQSAQIYVSRESDIGQANANIYAFWTDTGSPGAMPAPNTTDINRHDLTKIGTLAKGQASWLDIPSSFYTHMNTDMKGIGLYWKDPVKADAMPDDYSVVYGTATNLRSGELHVVWEEQL